MKRKRVRSKKARWVVKHRRKGGGFDRSAVRAKTACTIGTIRLRRLTFKLEPSMIRESTSAEQEILERVELDDIRDVVMRRAVRC